MVMPSKLTTNVYSDWIITTNGFSQQTSKGVVVGTEGATTEGQFIQTLTIFNVGVLPKRCNKLVCTAHQKYKAGTHSKGVLISKEHNRHVKGELGLANIMYPAT